MPRRSRQELANAQAKAQEILTQAGAQGNKMIEEARAVGGQGFGSGIAEGHRHRE